MPNTKPLPEFRNHSEEYEQAAAELMRELEKGMQSAREGGWIDIEDVEKELGITYEHD